MALKFQLGGNAPTLYNFYGKLYNYNDLAQAADQGLNEYLQTLRRGDKDATEFRDAYSNLMTGIKDGSITFDNGKFHDTQGRYTNSDKKNRDYYGLMANYIYGKMGKSEAYKKPEDTSKLKWQEGAVKTALMHQLYNSDLENLQDFLDLDKVNNGVRSIANRSTYLANAFLNIADNWDTTFADYLDADKALYVPLLLNAAKALRDGSIDEGDYLALSKAVGGVDFRNMLATGKPALAIQTAPTAPTAPKLRNAALYDGSFTNDSISKITATMSRVPTNSLIEILRNTFYNKHYNFGDDSRIKRLFKGYSRIGSRAGTTATLLALYNLGVLKLADLDNPNLYYIPGLTTKAGTSWVWDKEKNTVIEMKSADIPYFTLAQSVIKAQQGTKLPWYGGITDYDPKGYLKSYGYTLYGMNNKGVYGNAYGNNGRGMNDSRYKTDSNYSDYSETGKKYATDVEGQQYYKDFTNALINGAKEYNKDTSNDDNNVFVRWAHLYDKSLPSNSTSSFFDKDGNLRNKWEVNNKDSYMRGPNLPITNLELRITTLRNDQLLANGHNDLMLEGTRYFYNDNNGTKHWVDPETAKKYTISKDDIKSTEGNTNWTDYELTGPSTANLSGNLSDINLTLLSNKLNWFDKNGKQILKEVTPNLIAAGRMMDSLYTNNKVADVLSRSIKPTLQNTYERYSPVTGAFSEMEFRNRQAADVQRQAAQPYTSDASLNAARSLDANRQANDLQYQGFLADDKEIQRTKAEALLRQEDNIARRTLVANLNREAINQADRARGEIEAQRLNSNWQSRNNFLQGIESDLRQKNAYTESQKLLALYENRARSLALDIQGMSRPWEVKARYLKLSFDRLKQDLARELQAKVANYKSVNGEDADYTTLDFYKDFIARSRALEDLYMRDSDDLAVELTNAEKQYITDLQNKMHNSSLFYRKGGKLSNKSILLINNIINQ